MCLSPLNIDFTILETSSSSIGFLRTFLVNSRSVLSFAYSIPNSMYFLYSFSYTRITTNKEINSVTYKLKFNDIIVLPQALNDISFFIQWMRAVCLTSLNYFYSKHFPSVYIFSFDHEAERTYTQKISEGKYLFKQLYFTIFVLKFDIWNISYFKFVLNQLFHF